MCNLRLTKRKREYEIIAFYVYKLMFVIIRSFWSATWTIKTSLPSELNIESNSQIRSVRKATLNLKQTKLINYTKTTENKIIVKLRVLKR